MQFLANFDQIINWRHPVGVGVLWENLDPPLVTFNTVLMENINNVSGPILTVCVGVTIGAVLNLAQVQMLASSVNGP